MSVVKTDFHGDLRRITIEQNDTFIKFYKKVQQLYSLKGLKLSYMDDDGDKVVLGTDFELKQALECAGKRSLKILVDEGPELEEKEVEEQELLLSQLSTSQLNAPKKQEKPVEKPQESVAKEVVSPSKPVVVPAPEEIKPKEVVSPSKPVVVPAPEEIKPKEVVSPSKPFVVPAPEEFNRVIFPSNPILPPKKEEIILPSNPILPPKKEEIKPQVSPSKPVVVPQEDVPQTKHNTTTTPTQPIQIFSPTSDFSFAPSSPSGPRLAPKPAPIQDETLNKPTVATSPSPFSFVSPEIVLGANALLEDPQFVSKLQSLIQETLASPPVMQVVMETMKPRLSVLIQESTPKIQLPSSQKVVFSSPVPNTTPVIVRNDSNPLITFPSISVNPIPPPSVAPQIINTPTNAPPQPISLFDSIIKDTKEVIQSTAKVLFEPPTSPVLNKEEPTTTPPIKEQKSQEPGDEFVVIDNTTTTPQPTNPTSDSQKPSFFSSLLNPFSPPFSPAPQPNKPSESPSPYNEELESILSQLESMGFNNREENSRIALSHLARGEKFEAILDDLLQRQ